MQGQRSEADLQHEEVYVAVLPVLFRIMLVIYTLYKPPHVSSVHRIRTAYGGLSNKSSTSGSR